MIGRDRVQSVAVRCSWSLARPNNRAEGRARLVPLSLFNPDTIILYRGSFLPHGQLARRIFGTRQARPSAKCYPGCSGGCSACSGEPVSKPNEAIVGSSTAPVVV